MVCLSVDLFNRITTFANVSTSSFLCSKAERGTMYDNYAKIRNKKGLSDYQLSKDLGISRSIFSDWKSGRHSPSKKNRYRISQALGLPPVDYFYSDNENEYLIEQPGQDTTAPLADRVASYTVKMLSGKTCQLTADEYNELQNAIDVFIDSWIKTKKRL